MADPDEAEGSGSDGESSGAQIRTFLIADVRGYTLFTQERGDEAAAKLASKFADIARETVEGRGGTLLELRGDEALCVFSSTREAIRAALDLQERFVEETIASPELPLTVGVGLDAGEAVPVQGGYRGGALNLAARLCGQARAGEILATREVVHLARRLDGVRYEDRGSLTFKGIEEPVAVVRIVPEGADPVEQLRPFAPATQRPKRARRWPIVAGVGALVVALIAISVPLLRNDGDRTAVASNSVARMDAADGSVTLTTPLGERPGASAIGAGSLWVAHPDRGYVSRIDLEDGSVVDTIPVGASPAGVAIDGGSVWVTNAADGTVSRIDEETNNVTQEFPAGAGPAGIAVGDGALWIADAVGIELLRVDPDTGAQRAVPLAGHPSGVAFTPEGVWVSVAPNGVALIDPADLSVTLTQTVGNGPAAVMSAFESIWVANTLDGTVTRFDPATGRVVSTIPVGQGPNSLAAANGLVWVANELDDSISAIDPASNTIERTVPVGASAASLAAAGDELWVAVGVSANEHRGGTLSVSSPGSAPTSLDPAVVFDPMGWQILSVTNDGLVAYEKVGGPGGAALVPDLASALPNVSSDGLTYRFPLRPGIRYSTGDLVQPEDFRHGLERALALSRSLADLYSAIDGADACTIHPPVCDLSGSIIAEEDAVTIRLAHPDPDLLLKLALPAAFPVPVTTPFDDQGLEAVPATGPYMVSRTASDSLELVRNPSFRVWSSAAQPDGFVDTISWRFRQPQGPAFDELIDGDVDWMTEVPLPADLAELQAKHPDQLAAAANPQTYFVGFDVREPPFDDARVRQALNYAIDRALVVELLGGPTTQRSTCQILPPGFQGYEAYCPYTLDPGAGAWSAPDQDRAEALIEDAHAAGARVTAWAAEWNPGVVAVMRHVVDVLNDVGLDAELKVVDDPKAYFAAIYGSGRAQLYLSGWIANYLGAGGFLDSQFRCGAPDNSAGLCSDALDAAMQDAQELQATDPAAANQAWIEIEHRLVDDAVWAPLTNPIVTYAFSERTGNVQIHPQWGVLLSRIWVQ